MTGASASRTVTMVMQLVVLPEGSVTVKVTGCMPMGSSVPARGDWVTLATAQLSVALTRPTRLDNAAMQLESTI